MKKERKTGKMENEGYTVYYASIHKAQHAMGETLFIQEYLSNFTDFYFRKTTKMAIWVFFID